MYNIDPPSKPHFLAYPCHTCGAKIGERCQTKNGRLINFHADRIWQGIDDGWVFGSEYVG